MASTESQARDLGIRIAPNARMFSYEIYSTGLPNLLCEAREAIATGPKGSSIRESLAGRGRITFVGLRRFVELLQKGFAFRRINLRPLVEPRIVDGDCGGDGQRFREPEMFGGKRPRRGLADRKQAKHIIGHHERDADPGADVAERLVLAPLALFARVGDMHALL